MFEAGALTVGGISILTIIVQNSNFDVQKHGSLNWGVCCMDNPLIN